KTAAYRTDVTQGATPIYRTLSNLSGAKSAYGNIVYAKAPAVLRQAEFYVGEPVFRRAVRQFLKGHAYAAADWNDLVVALERASGRKLKRWAEAWVERRGMAEVRLAWDTDRDGRPKNTVLEQHNVLNEGGTWPMKLRVFALSESGLPRSADALLRGRSTSVREIDGMPEIDFAFANFGDYGYGRFLLDPMSREAVLARPLPRHRAAARARRPGGEGPALRADRRGFRRRRPPLRLRRRRGRAQRRSEARLLRALLQRAGSARKLDRCGARPVQRGRARRADPTLPRSRARRLARI